MWLIVWRRERAGGNDGVIPLVAARPLMRLKAICDDAHRAATLFEALPSTIDFTSIDASGRRGYRTTAGTEIGKWAGGGDHR